MVLVFALSTIWLRWRAAPRARYETRLVDRGPIDETVLATGTLQPVLTVNVGSQISGQVLQVFVDYNSVVRKGQLLARIDPRTLQAQREQAQADLSNARAAVRSAAADLQGARTNVAAADAGVVAAEATLAQARAARRTADAQLVQARASVNRTRAQSSIARITYSRNLDLVNQRLVAPQDIDAARASLLTAEADEAGAGGQVRMALAGIVGADANVRNALAALVTSRIRRATAQAQLESAHAQQGQALSQLEKTRATLRQIVVNLGYVEIRSPIDGVIISRLVDPGQTVAASFQTPQMFQVATALRRCQVMASVDESDISRVFVGQSVSFTVNAWPNRVFRGGRVVSIRNAWQSVQNVVTYPVLIDARNDALVLRPGMTANLTLAVAHRDDVVRVPNAALRFQPADEAAVHAPPERQVVWVTSPDGRLRPRFVSCGITDGVHTEVLDAALQPGESVGVGLITSASATGAGPVPRATR